MDQLSWDDIVEIPTETLLECATAKAANSGDDRFRVFVRRE